MKAALLIAPLLVALVLLSACGKKGSPSAPGPAGEIVLVVDDVDAFAEALRDRGVQLLSEPADRPWGHRTLHVADPDGFVVEFAQEIPRARSRRTD